MGYIRHCLKAARTRDTKTKTNKVSSSWWSKSSYAVISSGYHFFFILALLGSTQWYHTAVLKHRSLVISGMYWSPGDEFLMRFFHLLLVFFSGLSLFSSGGVFNRLKFWLFLITQYFYWLLELFWFIGIWHNAPRLQSLSNPLRSPTYPCDLPKTKEEEKREEKKTTKSIWKRACSNS